MTSDRRFWLIADIGMLYTISNWKSIIHVVIVVILFINIVWNKLTIKLFSPAYRSVPITVIPNLNLML